MQELGHDLLHIRVASGSTDGLECLLVLLILFHLLLHLGLEESTPELLSEVVLLHLKLIRVFFLIGSLLSDDLLAFHAVDSALKSILLVLNGFIESGHFLTTLAMILINHQHE